MKQNGLEFYTLKNTRTTNTDRKRGAKVDQKALVPHLPSPQQSLQEKSLEYA